MRLRIVEAVFLVISVALVIISAEDASTPLICTKCKCIPENKTLDCSYAKLLSPFTTDDWQALKGAGEFVYETVSFRLNALNNLTRFPSLPIKHLDLSHNDIAAIEPRAFYDLDQLETLDLSNNRIDASILKPSIFEGKYDPTTYEPLKNLKVLHIGNNLIHTLDPDIFQHLNELEELYMNDNPFTKINTNTEVALSNIGKLKILDMSALELKTLPEDIFHAISTLEVLNIARNGFHHIPEALQDLKNVRELNMDENPVNDLDEWNKFPDLPKLEKLSLSYISMMEIIGDGAFSGLTGLKEFHAVHNMHLREIHANAFSRPGQEDPTREEWPPLEKLFLHNNNLSYLDPHTFANWDTMKEIDIRSNPWQCDCENEWIIQEVVPKLLKDNPGLVENLSCAGPSPLEKKTFKELTEKEAHLRCPDKYGNNPTRDGTILIGLLLGICIGIPFTLMLIIFYKRGCFGLVRTKGPADFSRAYYQRAGVYDDTMHHI